MDSTIIAAIIGFLGMIIAAFIGKASESERKTSQNSENNKRTVRWGFAVSIATFLLGASTLVMSLLIYLQSNRVDTNEDALTSIVVDEPTASVETTEFSSIPNESTEKVETEYEPPYILPGTTKAFGHYEQDNKDLNGAETIEWIALAQNDNEVLIVSVLGLEASSYYKGEGASDWENSSIRAWLNGTFYQNAFSAEEKDNIIQKTIIQHKNKDYPYCKQGADTLDSVFLLSLEEYTEYIYNNGNIDTEYRYGIPSTYVSEKLKADITSETQWWWLRTSSGDNTTACAVTGYGVIDYGFKSIHNTTGMVRPAMWVNADWWDSL